MRTLSLTAALLVLAGSLALAGLPRVADAAGVTVNMPSRGMPPGGMSPGGMSPLRPDQPSIVAVRKFGVWEIRCLKAPLPPAKDQKKAKSDSEAPSPPTRVYAGVTIVTTFTCRAVVETHYNNNPLLGVRLVFLLLPPPSGIRVLAVFPPRFTLSALKGPRLKLDGAVLPLRPYSHCDPLECGASMQLPLARLGDFRKAKSIVLELPDLQNTKPFEYTIPAAGLPQAIAALQELETR